MQSLGSVDRRFSKELWPRSAELENQVELRFQERAKVIGGSPRERIERLRILTKGEEEEGGQGFLEPLLLNPAQEKIYVLLVERGNYLGDYLILKPRQIGVSTIILGVFYDRIKHVEGINAAVYTHHPKATGYFREIVHRFWAHDPERPDLKYDNAGEFSLKARDSRIYIGTIGERGVGKARTLHMLFCTELAEWPRHNAEEQWLGLPQTVPRRTGLRIRESTPKGRENIWHRMWNASREKRPHDCLFFRWWDHQEYRCHYPASGYDEEEQALVDTYGLDPYQIAWRREMIDEYGEDGFQQEYAEDEDTCFLVTGETVFDKAVLMKLLQTLQHVQPVLQRDDLTVWEYPVEGRFYVAGSDVGSGSPLGDYSATVILDWETGKQVARIWDHLRPEEFATNSAALCTMYNNAYWGIEEADHGRTVLYILTVQSPYGNLFYRDRGKPGWRTDRATRPVMLDELKAALREGSMGVRDRDFVLECLSFVRTAAHPDGEADAGAHDDLVFAWGIAWRMRAQSGPPSPLVIRDLLP